MPDLSTRNSLKGLRRTVVVVVKVMKVVVV
jgi:hypothetical protein